MGRYLYDQEREAIERKAAAAAEAASVAERIRYEKKLATQKADHDRRIAMAQAAKREAVAKAAAERKVLEAELEKRNRENVVLVAERAERLGCPPELYPELIDELCADIQRYPYRTACEKNGLTVQKLNSWRAKATPGAHPLILELNRRVAMAKAEGDAEQYDRVMKASEAITGTIVKPDGTEQDILLQRADAKVQLELARARMPELSARAIIPVEEKPEEEVDLSLLSDEELKVFRAAEDLKEKLAERSASLKLQIAMNTNRILPVDTTGEDVVESSDAG